MPHLTQPSATVQTYWLDWAALPYWAPPWLQMMRKANQAAPPELIAIQQAATKFSQANTPKRDFWRQRRQQLNELINAGDDFVRPLCPTSTVPLNRSTYQ